MYTIIHPLAIRYHPLSFFRESESVFFIFFYFLLRDDEQAFFLNSLISIMEKGTCATYTAYPSGASGFTLQVFGWGFCCSIISYLCNALQIVVCPFVLSLLAIVLCINILLTASDYPFKLYSSALYFLLDRNNQYCSPSHFQCENRVMTYHNLMWLDRNEIIRHCIKLTYN